MKWLHVISSWTGLMIDSFGYIVGNGAHILLSRFLTISRENDSISSCVSPTSASWNFHRKAPSSTSASPMHALDRSASFWPLSSLALYMNSIHTIRIENSSHLDIPVSHFNIAVSHTRPCICILEDVCLDGQQLQLFDTV